MKQIILSLLIALALYAKPAQADERPELRAVISSQIEAFRADDFAKAFEFASPNIQEMFRTPQNFGAMVKSGYPMVWRPDSVRFLEAREIAGRLWQKVMISDAKGAVYLLDYNMIEVDGRWKINAVQMIDSPEVSA